MNKGFYIMKLWQTGNVGSHNIEKKKENPKDGFKTYKQAETAMMKMKKSGDFELNCDHIWTFTIMKIYQP